MDPSPQQLKGEDVLSLLNAAIDAVNVAEVSTTAPTIDVYNSVGVLLTIIRVRFLHFSDEKSQLQLHVEPGLHGQ